MDVDDEEKAKPTTPKAKKPKIKKPRKPLDATKYMDRVRALLLVNPGEREARKGSIITEKQIQKRFTNLTDDELKFVQKENMTDTDLERLKSIADRTQYHGFYLKYVFGKEGVPLGRFVNETSEVSETDDKVRVYLDNIPDDLKKRAQKTGRVVTRTIKQKIGDDVKEIVKQYPETKVIYIGEVCGPGEHKPLMTEYRIMNADYAKVVDVVDSKMADSKMAGGKMAVDGGGKVAPTPSTPPPPKAKQTTSPKRSSPGRPPKVVNKSPDPKSKFSVPPPQTITKAPNANVGTGTGARTVSTSLKKQVVQEVAKHHHPSTNGLHHPGDE